MNKKDALPGIMKRIRESGDPLLDIKYHLAHPQIKLEAYTKARLLMLGREAVSKRVIYLDQNFWINLRRVKLGQSADKKYIQLYNKLKMLCSGGGVICPINFSHYAETLRQADPQSRLQTFELMDELCCGFSIIPNNDLSSLEVVNFLMQSVIGSEQCYKNEELAWIYSGYVTGLVHPYETGFDEDTELAIQKMLFEHTRHRTLGDTIRLLDDAEKIRIIESDEEFQRKQTEECNRHRSEYKTFNECYFNEISGCVDLHRDSIIHALTRLWEIKNETSATDGDVRRLAASAPDYEDAIRRAFKQGRIKGELPCLDIPASCHALKRYKQIPFKKGDRFDFMHARTALPYCDYFLTERVLGEMLCDKLVRLDVKYECKILWDIDMINSEFSGV